MIELNPLSKHKNSFGKKFSGENVSQNTSTRNPKVNFLPVDSGRTDDFHCDRGYGCMNCVSEAHLTPKLLGVVGGILLVQ